MRLRQIPYAAAAAASNGAGGGGSASGTAIKEGPRYVFLSFFRFLNFCLKRNQGKS